jgi:hypothetical protein
MGLYNRFVCDNVSLGTGALLLGKKRAYCMEKESILYVPLSLHYFLMSRAAYYWFVTKEMLMVRHYWEQQKRF